MHNLAIQLRIGEKIGIGFGLVSLLFLGVIWQFQDTLNRSLGDYKQLQSVQAASKDKILAIESELLQARMAEGLFRSTRDLHMAERVEEHINAAQMQSSQLLKIDTEAEKLSDMLSEHLQNYLDHFQQVEAAWVHKGLDENSGLQGSFREAVHDLETMAGNLNTDNLYLNLLQIRRGEKDLGLRRDNQYQHRVYELIGQFEISVQESDLLQKGKDELLADIEAYKNEFSIYAEKVLQGGDLQGGKGPFRDAAHRIEKLIIQYYVPDLERDILQLRRREKDYLLRSDNQYVEMALKQVEVIENRIKSAGISEEHRKNFISLLHGYRDDFLLLVEQSNKISALTEKMDLAASHVIELVNTNVQSANSRMDEVIRNINATSKQRTEMSYWVVVIAIALGIFFAVMITRRIVVPMRQMTVLLERLTYTELVDPIHHVDGGRDEVNAMAGYLNTLAEHRNRFINWWKGSMDEAIAFGQLKDLVETSSQGETVEGNNLDDVKADLIEALTAKRVLISEEFNDVRNSAEQILHASAILQHPSISRGDVDEQGRNIHYSAEMIRKSLDMMSAETMSRT
ncbi:MAG: hypothetical protein ABW126_14175 [Candidatus Sedimenticola sp. 4PFRAG1]